MKKDLKPPPFQPMQPPPPKKKKTIGSSCDVNSNSTTSWIMSLVAISGMPSIASTSLVNQHSHDKITIFPRKIPSKMVDFPAS